LSRQRPKTTTTVKIIAVQTDNKSIANILYETADLLEVAAEDSFRVRSYRRAAEAIEGHDQQLADI
jgi:DNA polymerase (family 10)